MARALLALPAANSVAARIGGRGGENAASGDSSAQVRFNRRLSRASPAHEAVQAGTQSELTDREWQVLSAGCQTRRFADGEIIVDVDSVKRSIYRVRSGVVLVRQRCLNGTWRERRVRSGQIFGESAIVLVSRVSRRRVRASSAKLIDRAQDTFTSAKAASDCEVDEVAAHFLLQLFEHRPPLAALFFRVTANRLARQVVHEARKDGRERSQLPAATSGSSAFADDAQSEDASEADADDVYEPLWEHSFDAVDSDSLSRRSSDAVGGRKRSMTIGGSNSPSLSRQSSSEFTDSIKRKSEKVSKAPIFCLRTHTHLFLCLRPTTK